MSLTTINIHALEGLKVSSENLWNSHSLTLITPRHVEIVLYLPFEQWVLLRALPKADDYYFVKQPGVHERDHAAADELAKAWIKRELSARRGNIEPASPNHTSGIYDECGIMVGAARD